MRAYLEDNEPIQFLLHIEKRKRGIWQMNFGTIAVRNISIDELKELCDQLEQEYWLGDYVILEGKNGWNTISDENMEWGNMDPFHIFLSGRGYLTLSTEYCEYSLRYQLWENGVCIAAETIGESEDEEPNPENERLFAEKLQIPSAKIAKLFQIADVDANIMILGSLLKCQLWRCDEYWDETKVLKADIMPTKKAESMLKTIKLENDICTQPDSRFHVEREVVLEGTLVGRNLGVPVIYRDAGENRVFYEVDEKGEIQIRSQVPKQWCKLDHEAPKYYVQGDYFGLAATDSRYLLYKNGKLVMQIPNKILMTAWHAYMPDLKHIFMNLACYDIETGQKIMDFPRPEAAKNCKEYAYCERWRELPGGLIFSATIVDREWEYLMLMDHEGTIKTTIAVSVENCEYNIGIENEYIYFLKIPYGSFNSPEVTIFDFKLNKVGSYSCSLDTSLITRKIYFDEQKEYFYAVCENSIVQVAIKTGNMKKYTIPAIKVGHYYHDWALLPSGILYLTTTNKRILFFDTQQEMKWVFEHKMKYWLIRCYSWKNKGVLLALQRKEWQKEVVFQYIHW